MVRPRLSTAVVIVVLLVGHAWSLRSLVKDKDKGTASLESCVKCTSGTWSGNYCETTDDCSSFKGSLCPIDGTPGHDSLLGKAVYYARKSIYTEQNRLGTTGACLVWARLANSLEYVAQGSLPEERAADLIRATGEAFAEITELESFRPQKSDNIMLHMKEKMLAAASQAEDKAVNEHSDAVQASSQRGADLKEMETNQATISFYSMVYKTWYKMVNDAMHVAQWTVDNKCDRHPIRNNTPESTDIWRYHSVFASMRAAINKFYQESKISETLPEAQWSPDGVSSLSCDVMVRMAKDMHDRILNIPQASVAVLSGDDLPPTSLEKLNKAISDTNAVRQRFGTDVGRLTAANRFSRILGVREAKALLQAGPAATGVKGDGLSGGKGKKGE